VLRAVLNVEAQRIAMATGVWHSHQKDYTLQESIREGHIRKFLAWWVV